MMSNEHSPVFVSAFFRVPARLRVPARHGRGSCGKTASFGDLRVSIHGGMFPRQDVHQAIAEVDPVFAVNAVYVYEQVPPIAFMSMSSQGGEKLEVPRKGAETHAVI